MDTAEQKQVWRWLVDPFWENFSSTVREAYATGESQVDIERYHHLRATLFFAITALEAFLNEQMRHNRKRKNENFQSRRLANPQLCTKIYEWPKEIVEPNFVVDSNISGIIDYIRKLRGEVVHPKDFDHSLYRELDNLDANVVPTAVAHYCVKFFEGLNKPYPYWLLGWNFVGANSDPTWPIPASNDQFLHSLNALGLIDFDWTHEQFKAFEDRYMKTLVGFQQLDMALQSVSIDIEPRWPEMPTKPRLCRKWWDKAVIQE